MRHIRSADLSNEFRISAHHKLIAGTGQSDVEPLTGSVPWLRLVQRQYHDAPFESLEAEHMAVEHLLGIPEGVPVGGVAQLLAVDLFGMAAARRQQGDVLGPPPLVEERVDLVVGGVESVVGVAGDEPRVGPVTAPKLHTLSDKGTECGRDLADVAQIVVEDQGHQRDRWRPLPVEDPLVFVAEQVDATGVRITQAGEQRQPPVVSEVLRLVDDDGVEAVAGWECLGELDHLAGQCAPRTRRPPGCGPIRQVPRRHPR